MQELILGTEKEAQIHLLVSVTYKYKTQLALFHKTVISMCMTFYSKFMVKKKIMQYSLWQSSGDKIQNEHG
jgi:hypothetical protein